jgi:predicted ATP-dependent protease
MIASMARGVKARPLTREGVARLIEHASRLASDQRKLTAHDRVLKDLLSEADHWAGQDGAELITDDYIQQAIDEREYRASRVRERSMEQITRGIVKIATEGEEVGQVNGLSVLRLGASMFGQPARITATACPGKGQVVDIEREAKLGGPIHSKAVMILSSLAFEQSYGGVEGDSASVAETCVLLSAIAGVPLKQSFAVTGSVNQHGEVQAVGGVNEKIEGFFNVCRNSGNLGNQGVLLPESNVEHLMLRKDVRDAMGEGRFTIYPISDINEAIELLTDMEAGVADENGDYPEGSFNRKVQDRLAAFAEVGKKQDEDKDNGDDNGGKENDD